MMDPKVEGTVGGEMLDRMLSKREQFAVAALQGILANERTCTFDLTAARVAVWQADRLIIELDRG